MSYGYDAAGNMLSAADSINGTPAGTNTYTFDPLNRVTRMQQSGAGVTNKRVDYAYNAVGQPVNVKRFSDLAGTQTVAETTHTFDRLNRLTTINHSRGSTPLASYNYGYDANSRITSVTNRDGTSTNTYDDTDQLTGVDYSFQPDEVYTYDANGNRSNPGYATGAHNRLLSDGKFSYEYDGEGNVIKQTDILTGEITLYTWDYRNRLTNVMRNGVTVGDYAYDVYDQRIGKVTPTGTERFVYGQNQNIALEFDGSGTLTNRYLHGNSIDAILADEANGSVGWALTDNLGSVRDVVDATGTSQNHVVFDSFGNVTSETNPGFDTRFSFTGREFDAETGNYDYRARPYRPSSGRFIEEDPIRFSAGDANFYRYLENLPVSRIDPLGLQSSVWDSGKGLPIPYIDFEAIGNAISEGASNTGKAISELGKAIERGLVPPAGDPEADRRAGARINRKRPPKGNPDDDPLPVPFPLQDRIDPRKPPCEDDPKGENQMIVQLQRLDTDTHQVIRRNNSKVGVRVGQMNNALQELFQTYPTRAPWFKKEYETAFIKGMSSITQFMAKLPPSGVTTGGTIYTFQWNGDDDPQGKRAAKGTPDKSKRRELRVELENKRGHNLRYF